MKIRYLLPIATVALVLACNNSDNVESENLQAVAAMNQSFARMADANDSLEVYHTGPHYHHHDSIYHHHDSIYVHEHHNYHDGDTIHHEDGEHHTMNDHHLHDSITLAHHNIAH